MLFSIASFLLNPIQFVKGWVWSRRNFDKNGYLKHKLTMTEVNDGIQYSCSCGWSNGWIGGTREDARRINAVAHQNWWERKRP